MSLLLKRRELSRTSLRSMILPVPREVMQEICTLLDTTPDELSCYYDPMTGEYECVFGSENSLGQIIVNTELLMGLLEWMIVRGLEDILERNKISRIPMLERLIEKEIGERAEKLPELVRRILREEMEKENKKSTGSRTFIPTSITYRWTTRLVNAGNTSSTNRTAS